MKTPHIREYLPSDALTSLYKSAEMAPPEEAPVERPDWGKRLKLIGSGLAGAGVGTLAGFGAMELADRALGGGGAASARMGIPASALNKIVPVASAGAGLAYALWKAREMEKLRHAVQSSPDDSSAAQ